MRLEILALTPLPCLSRRCSYPKDSSQYCRRPFPVVYKLIRPERQELKTLKPLFLLLPLSLSFSSCTMASLDGIPLSEYYLKAPTSAQHKAYKAARVAALADPLERGVLLPWNGPCLHPDALPPSDYPRNATPGRSPHPPRPKLRFLLDSTSPSQGGSGWSLKLLEGIKSGKDKWSQVWRCEVVAPSSSPPVSATVVLKLRHQALFPPPDDHASRPELDSWNWYPAQHLVRREAAAYRFAHLSIFSCGELTFLLLFQPSPAVPRPRHPHLLRLLHLRPTFQRSRHRCRS